MSEFVEVFVMSTYDAWVRLPGTVSRTGYGYVLGTVRIRLRFVPKTNPVGRGRWLFWGRMAEFGYGLGTF